jgi:glutamyl-tRNA reductase
VLSSLKIIHISHSEHSQQELETIQGKSYVWQTCLRTIVFSHEENTIEKYSDMYQGEHAYQFLLEVICGLHSKLIGETEIISQFKQFTKENPQAIAQNISDKLIQNSKTIRNKYLNGYGGQSYGSYVNTASKKYEKIVILGAGALTQDILPIIKTNQANITIKTKCTNKYSYLKLKYPHIKLDKFEHSLDIKNKNKLSTLIVIAAPINSHILENYITRTYKTAKVLDMRAIVDGPALQLDNTYQYQTLNNIFENLSSTHLKLKNKLPTIKQEIHLISKKWNEYILQRPYGWDDLC